MDFKMQPKVFNKLQNNYQVGKEMEHLAVLPTGTNIDLNNVKGNEFMADWMSDPGDTTTLYVFQKHVNTKKPVFSAIASSGKLSLNLNEKYVLQHDQTRAKICEATLMMTVEPAEYNDPQWAAIGFKKMSMMVFK